MSQVVHISVEPSARVDGIDHPSDWIHPYLVESANPFKGREFRATGSIAKGSCLLIDHPYAIIPVVDDPSANDNLICSYPDCNQRALGHSERSRCPQSCTPDVAWCSSACRIADQARHSFECIWLKRYASPIRKKWSEYDFGMLWLVVRLLATRQMQVSLSPGSKELFNSKTGVHSQSNWQRIESLCGSTQTWPRDRVKFWTNLVKRYLQSSDILPHDLTKEALLHIICQEEANSFGLYPRETGSSALNDQQDRGEQFAAAVYPVAAIMNHSCSPNVSLVTFLLY